MEYVSAEWVIFEDGIRVIKAIGDDGREYFIPEADTDVPPWPDFLMKRGLDKIAAAPEPEPQPVVEKQEGEAESSPPLDPLTVLPLKQE